MVRLGDRVIRKGNPKKNDIIEVTEIRRDLKPQSVKGVSFPVARGQFDVRPVEALWAIAEIKVLSNRAIKSLLERNSTATRS